MTPTPSCRRKRLLTPAVLVVALTATCSESGQLPSPTVRVPLWERLPIKAQRQFAAADTTYECSRKVKLAGKGAAQRFVVTWRLFEAGEGVRFITAVQVDPDGPFEGGRGPKASALVSGTKGKNVSVQIRWSATKGCSSINAQTTIQLRTDDPDCKPPKPAGGKIFSR
jgi:hypothetical protein